jgi:hypothetical protein
VFGGNMRERDLSGDPGVDGKKISKWIFIKWNVGCGLDRADSG